MRIPKDSSDGNNKFEALITYEEALQSIINTNFFSAVDIFLRKYEKARQNTWRNPIVKFDREAAFNEVSDFIKNHDPNNLTDERRLYEIIKNRLGNAKKGDKPSRLMDGFEKLVNAYDVVTQAKKSSLTINTDNKEKVVQDNNNVALQPSTTEKDSNVYLQEGDRFFVEEDYAESLRSYESALKLQPGNMEALVHKGKVLQKLNRLEEAKQTYQEVITIEDKDAEEYYQQAKRQLKKIEKKQVLLQQQLIPTIVSVPTESIISESTEREELLGRVSSKTELRKPNIQLNPTTKQTKPINPSATIPLSQNPVRVQFSPKTPSLQTTVSKQNKNNSKEESSEMAEEKNSTKILR